VPRTTMLVSVGVVKSRNNRKENMGYEGNGLGHNFPFTEQKAPRSDPRVVRDFAARMWRKPHVYRKRDAWGGGGRTG